MKLSKTQISKIIQSKVDFLVIQVGTIEAAKKGAPILAKNAENYLLSKGINEFNKIFTETKCSRITTKIEIKYIKKFVRSNEKNGVSLKGTTEKILK